MDVITAHENGFRNVVACMGTAVTSFQLQELSKLLSNPPRGVTSSITLCLDSDAAGEEATLRGLEEAWRSDAGRGPGSARNSVAVNVARSVGGKDPDEAIRTDPEGWRTSIANGQPLLDYLITAYSDRRDLFSGEGKAGLVGDVRPLILAIENSFEQDRYLTKLGELLSVPPERLRSMMQGPRPIPRGTRMGMGRRAAPARRSTEERLDPAQVSNALDAANENGLEEHLLTLVLNYDNLRDYATGVPEDHFRDSGNRAIFTMWRTALTLDEVHSSMDDHLAGRVDQLKSKPLPPGDHLLKVQDVSQTVRRLHERHLRHMKRLQTEAFAPDDARCSCGRVAAVAPYRRRGGLETEASLYRPTLELMPRRPRTTEEDEPVVVDLADTAELLRLGITQTETGFDDDSSNGSGPSVLLSASAPSSASELEGWDQGSAAASAERRATMIWDPAVEDSEITDDPVRMYLPRDWPGDPSNRTGRAGSGAGDGASTAPRSDAGGSGRRGRREADGLPDDQLRAFNACAAASGC